MLWCICFLNYGDRQAISAIFPKLYDEFHFDTVQLGLIGSAFMWVYALAAPLAGYVGDRLRRKGQIGEAGGGSTPADSRSARHNGNRSRASPYLLRVHWLPMQPAPPAEPSYASVHQPRRPRFARQARPPILIVGMVAGFISAVHGVSAFVVALAEWDVPRWLGWILFPISHTPFKVPESWDGPTFVLRNELLFSLYLAVASLIAWMALRAWARGAFSKHRRRPQKCKDG
jgi:hypothetical protein